MPGKAMVLDIEGLEKLRNDMRATAAGTQKRLQVHFKEVATIVASAIADRVPVSTNKPKGAKFKSGSARASIRPQASSTWAGVAWGGPKAPYYPWLDFGGGVWNSRGVTARPKGEHRRATGDERRPFIKAGRYVYPTIVDMHDVIVDAAAEAMIDALVDNGWKRTGG